ncbi:MAG: transposase [Acidobacteria bacterium]|nr:transposase [Acidobacteriota bacterium]
MSNSYGSNLDEYGFERYEENVFPIAYLITFRTFGTWLHGDDRGSMQRTSDPRFGTVLIDRHVPLFEQRARDMRQPAVILNLEQRRCIEEAFWETCSFRGYALRAVNVRSNHAHSVISAPVKPEKIVNDLKVNATKQLRHAGLVGEQEKVWSRGASTRYLWKPRHVDAAIEYVLYSQGDVPFEAVTEIPED